MMAQDPGAQQAVAVAREEYTAYLQKLTTTVEATKDKLSAFQKAQINA